MPHNKLIEPTRNRAAHCNVRANVRVGAAAAMALAYLCMR